MEEPAPESAAVNKEQARFTPVQSKTTMENIKIFLYNPETNRIMGRTPIRWLKLLICYVTVYSCLAGLSASMFSVFYYKILSENQPRRIMSQGLISDTAGVSIRPAVYDHPIFSSRKIKLRQKVKPFITSIQDFLDYYYERRGGKLDNGVHCTESTKLNKGQFCIINMSHPFPFMEPCSSTNAYGYLEGKPCIILKLNRVFGWKPVLYTQNNLPKDFPKNRFYKNRLIADCFGIHEADKENIGSIVYYPVDGISVKYYPYNGQKNYQSPFMWVHFPNITEHMIVKVRCKFFAKNIAPYFRVDIRYVSFELLVD